MKSRRKSCPREIENRRQTLKRQLLDSWKESVARNDIDGSIEILKRVDPYLTPAEAASMHGNRPRNFPRTAEQYARPLCPGGAR